MEFLKPLFIGFFLLASGANASSCAKYGATGFWPLDGNANNYAPCGGAPGQTHGNIYYSLTVTAVERNSYWMGGNAPGTQYMDLTPTTIDVNKGWLAYYLKPVTQASNGQAFLISDAAITTYMFGGYTSGNKVDIGCSTTTTGIDDLYNGNTTDIFYVFFSWSKTQNKIYTSVYDVSTSTLVGQTRYSRTVNITQVDKFVVPRNASALYLGLISNFKTGNIYMENPFPFSLYGSYRPNILFPRIHP